MNMAMILAMIPGAEDFKRQGLELLAAANKLTAAVDVQQKLAFDLSGTVSMADYASAEAAVFAANGEFKQCLARLPPLPEGL